MQLPVSPHPKIRLMSEKMAEEPAARQTLAQWASHFAMSERNLARGGKETGLSFRRWRHQLQLIVALQLLIGEVGTAGGTVAGVRLHHRVYHDV